MLSIRLNDRKISFEVRKGENEDVIADIVAETIENEPLRDIIFTSPRGARRISAIEEDLSDDIFFAYLTAYAMYGESFFLFAEIAGTRNCIEDYIASSGVSYESIGECGLAIADAYLGIPDGAMKYMDGWRLCEDMMANRGPAEIDGRVLVVQAMDCDAIYLYDMGWQTQPEPAKTPSLGGPQ